MTDNASHDSIHPVDAVIAWVDGSDPSLLSKREAYLPGTEGEKISSGAHATRFASVNEIRYCVLSILRFAPFVRNIFIITDRQDPGLDDDIKKYFPSRAGSVKIIDHTEIFEGYEKYLPTFNSISIGNMIWRIKGLSENFVYFNDDTFLLRPVDPAEWFRDNRPVLRGKWVMVPLLRIAWDKIKIAANRYLAGNSSYQPRASFHMGQWNSARLAGYRLRYFTNSHTPHTVGRKMVEDFFAANGERLEKNISFRFRHYSQFTFIALSNHLQLSSGNRQVASPDLVYLQPYGRSKNYIDDKIRLCEKNRDILYMCVQSLDLCSRDEQQKLLRWLESLLGLD